MRLRLYHHHDGARVAYRETGTGPALTLLHSLGLSHREWEPIVAPLSARFRVVLPDLPLHGDSEDRPRHPYTPDWLAEVIAGFCREVAGPRPLLAGHDIGAELALRAVTTGRLEPGAPGADVQPPAPPRRSSPASGRPWRATTRLGALPGLDRVLSHGATLRVPARRRRAALGAAQPGRARSDPPRVRRRRRQRQPGALVGEVRPALARRSRSARCSTPIRTIELPVLLLWAEEDPAYPLERRAGGARPASRRAAAHASRDRIPDGLRRSRSASRAS